MRPWLIALTALTFAACKDDPPQPPSEVTVYARQLDALADLALKNQLDCGKMADAFDAWFSENGKDFAPLHAKATRGKLKAAMGSRALATANRFGIELPSVARQVSPSDFEAFDLILAMDRSNRADLEDLGVTNVRLMRSFDATLTGEYDVPDPYYGDGDGFVKVYEMLTRACDGLIEHLTRD